MRWCFYWNRAEKLLPNVKNGGLRKRRENGRRNLDPKKKFVSRVCHSIVVFFRFLFFVILVYVYFPIRNACCSFVTLIFLLRLSCVLFVHVIVSFPHHCEWGSCWCAPCGLACCFVLCFVGRRIYALLVWCDRSFPRACAIVQWMFLVSLFNPLRQQKCTPLNVFIVNAAFLCARRQAYIVSVGGKFWLTCFYHMMPSGGKVSLRL